VQNGNDLTVSLLASAVDMVECVDTEADVQMTVSSQSSSTHHHLNSQLTDGGLSCVFQHVACCCSSFMATCIYQLCGVWIN